MRLIDNAAYTSYCWIFHFYVLTGRRWVRCKPKPTYWTGAEAKPSRRQFQHGKVRSCGGDGVACTQFKSQGGTNQYECPEFWRKQHSATSYVPGGSDSSNKGWMVPVRISYELLWIGQRILSINCYYWPYWFLRTGALYLYSLCSAFSLLLGFNQALFRLLIDTQVLMLLPTTGTPCRWYLSSGGVFTTRIEQHQRCCESTNTLRCCRTRHINLTPRRSGDGAGGGKCCKAAIARPPSQGRSPTPTIWLVMARRSRRRLSSAHGLSAYQRFHPGTLVHCGGVNVS